jgi:prepilin-type processing-associated H-X9-DG protein
MNLRVSDRRNYALTRIEAIVVIFSLLLLVIMLLPALGAAARKRSKIGCANQLKQMGLAFRIWEGDHQDKYPMSLAAKNGGVMEFAAQGNAEAIFQTMSNELSTPRILVCPADKDRWPALSFRSPLTSSNLSYFINPDSNESNPQDIMTGDDNLEIRGVRVKSGLLTISANNPIAWSADRHGRSGNVGMADGSCQNISNFGLTNYFLNSVLSTTNATSWRLAIP